VHDKQAGKPHDEAALKTMTEMGEQFMVMAETSTYLVIPPDAGNPDLNGWKVTGAALLETFQRGQMPAGALAYAGLAKAWRMHQPEQFNKLLQLFRADLAKRFSSQLAKSDAESRFNSAEPFYTSMLLYVIAFILAIFSWLIWPDLLGRSAFWLILLAWIVATGGIAARMWLEGRPPVTNLYSSALFVGWGAVALCLVLEALYHNAVGSVAAGAVGFATLLIAHHLSLGGDTLEMMRAVLDSNFWLGTHVVTVTHRLLRHLPRRIARADLCLPRRLHPVARSDHRRCARRAWSTASFALRRCSASPAPCSAASGRTNLGPLLGLGSRRRTAHSSSSLWNAIILHARWGELVGQRGMMCLAIFGNIVTAWSWFGVNMLGVGLHSYGFTDSAFIWLSAFVISQLLIIALANLPLGKWRSFQSDAAKA
jgi:hypothetical protein